MAKIIFYSPSCYGSWLNWVIRYLTDTNFTSELPFGDYRNNNSLSHGWYTREENEKNPIHLNRYNRILPELDTDNIYQLHPSITRDLDQFEDIDQLDHQIVWLHTSNENFAWSLNNFFFKMIPNFKDYFTKSFLSSNESIPIDYQSILFSDHTKSLQTHWPQTFYPHNDQLHTWIIREYLSLRIRETFNKTLFPMIRLNNMLNVNMKQLVDNFESTVNNILNYFKLPIARQNVDLLDLQTKWLATQPYVNKDQLINDIIDSVLNNTQLEWNSLTIVDEAIIQCILREQGYELKCHGLNDFPTNSKQLRELIYATQ